MRIKTAQVTEMERQHQALVRQGAPESMVLLKNEGILPFKAIKTVALYGNGARETIKGGTGSGDVNVRHFVTVEEGLQDAGLTVTTDHWLTRYSALKKQAEKAYYTALTQEAKDAGLDPTLALMGKTPLEPDYDLPLTADGDAAVYVLARNSGEGSDRQIARGDLQLTIAEKRDILALAQHFAQFVLVLNVGGVIDLTEVKNQVPAILLLSQLGTATGSALADVLLGKAYPSGKLTATWAPIDQYSTTANFGDPDDTEYREGIYVGYRYFDSVGQAPTYPFGYGLSYTHFTLTAATPQLANGAVSVAVAVQNTGNFPGKEVVQVYASVPANQLDEPYQTLVAYAKTSALAPGKTTTLTLTFPLTQLASFDVATAQMILPAGRYWLRIGNSSRQTTVVAGLNLAEPVVTAQYRHIGGTTGFTDFKPTTATFTYATEDTEKRDAPRLTINPAELVKETVHYPVDKATTPASGTRVNWADVASGAASVTAFANGLTDEELVRLLTGNYDTSHGDDLMSIIGNAATTVAGAAGETTHALTALGLPVLVMADGPAGLRLTPIYTETAAGQLQAVAGGSLTVPGTTTDTPVAPVTTPLYYQYCTAIPIGTAIAQTWNTALAEDYGDLVGEEMAQFDIDIWLAPALNIQRSPLDGRDFEYYSEDPLISGENAAAITRGVQRHPGKATTIKHFVANNQETNRQHSNSVVNERALRELYLKGFEIAVKTAQPHTMMSSYNLLNGTHVPNRRDIMTDVLRAEWGFKGFAMTDWLTTGGMGATTDKYGDTSASAEILAGSDMTMPGLPADTQAILAALQPTTDQPAALTRSQLLVSAERILTVILMLTQAR